MHRRYFICSDMEFICKPIEEENLKTKKKNLHKEIIEKHMEKSKPNEN